MKLIITIPENAVPHIVRYCRIEKIDLQKRMQGELDDFICNALGHMEQRRAIRKYIEAVHNRLKEIREIQNKQDAEADWHLFKEGVNAE